MTNAANSTNYGRLIQDLRAEYRPQREWAQGRGPFLVTGHFLVGVAAGGWLFGLLLGMTDMLIAAFSRAVLGGFTHLAFLGRPSRVLHMMTRPGSSWISRGFDRRGWQYSRDLLKKAKKVLASRRRGSTISANLCGA